MPKLPILRARELIKTLNKLGFKLYHQVGSHAQFKNTKGAKITVPVHGKKEIGKKTLKGIINDLGITVEEFIKLSN
ncbi:MAG: type II toxin-antitoxin system HicA family toxin [Patescibacteria group bacterium]|mgnify:FL=1